MDFTALPAPLLPLLLAIGTIGSVLLLPWLIVFPRLAIASLFVSLLMGQLIRLPLPGQPGGLLLSDLATSIVLVSAAFYLIRHRRSAAITTYHLLTTIPFILFALWTNLIHWSLTPSENLIALAYWFRLTTTLLLLPALLTVLSSPRLRRFTHYSLLTTTFILCLLGFIQWWFLADLSFLARYGWDPHQGRLVSTWLDPNLFGALLIIVLPWLLLKTTRRTPWPAVVAGFTGLFLTKSRSSLLAFGLTILIFSPLFIRYLIKRYQTRGAITIAAMTGLVIAVTASALFFLGDRTRGLLTIDITTQLRAESLARALPLASQHLLTGVGYNRYQFAAQAAGLIPSFTLHSRAGADNSILTVLITTGLPGLILFFLPWAFIVNQLIKKRAWPAFFSITALFIHSQFVNSFLYSHLLIALIIVVALALTNPRPGYLPVRQAGGLRGTGS